MEHSPTRFTGISAILWHCSFLALIVSSCSALAADGFLYYSRIPSITDAPTIRRVNADGSGDRPVPMDLPWPVYPTVSRDGRRLLVTSSDPGRPFKISNNVFIVDLASGASGRITRYEDTSTLRNNIILTNDLGDPTGTRNVSTYTIHSPYHKAFSPDGTRVVVTNLRKTGGVSLFTPLPNSPRDTTLIAASGRIPVTEIFRVADAMEEGSYVFLGIERTGFNQGGDGVDWHPTRNEVITTVSSDIPATGTAGIAGMEGTVLAGFTASGPSQFLGKLTSPQGRWDISFELSGTLSISTAEHDYAPAISPDGLRVAYVRHSLRIDSRFGLGPMPAQSSIRIINYNGTGDREVVAIADGNWVTRVAWSPDGTQLAFDIAPQMVLNGRFSQLGDATRSEIHVVNVDGTNPRLLVPAPAAHPTWAPGLRLQPVIRGIRRGNGFEIDVDNLAPGQRLQIEGTSDLQNWRVLSTHTAGSSSETISVPLLDQNRMGLYRLRVL